MALCVSAPAGRAKLLVGVLLAALGLDAVALNPLPTQSRPIQWWEIRDGFDIAVDTYPAWSLDYRHDGKQSFVLIETPDKYYPPASVVVKYFPDLKVPDDAEYMQQVAASAVKTANGSADAQAAPELTPIEFDNLKGYYQDRTTQIDGKDHSTRTMVMRTSNGRVMTLEAVTLPGKMPHLEAALRRIG